MQSYLHAQQHRIFHLFAGSSETVWSIKGEMYQYLGRLFISINFRTANAKKGLLIGKVMPLMYDDKRVILPPCFWET